MIKRKKMISLLLVLTLVSGMFVQTYATEIDDTKKKAEELESKKKAAENEKTSLADQLKKLTGEMEETKKKISAKEDEITNKEEELILAKADENEQYESMKKRIRYMYENGNVSFADSIMTSKNASQLLNRAEYACQFATYDRKMLKEYQAAGYAMILTSHGGPEGQDAVAEKIAYLNKTKEIMQQSKTADEFKANMKAAFPAYNGENYLDMTAGFLYK